MRSLTFTALLACSASLVACGGGSDPGSETSIREVQTLGTATVVRASTSSDTDTSAQAPRGFPADSAGYKVTDDTHSATAATH